jgi:hypothetical protein
MHIPHRCSCSIYTQSSSRVLHIYISWRSIDLASTSSTGRAGARLVHVVHNPLELVRFYHNPYGLRGIEGVLIPSKSKSLPIRINPLQSIWIENN